MLKSFNSCKHFFIWQGEGFGNDDDDDDDDDDDGGGGGDGGGDDDVFVPKTTFIKFLSRESQFDTIYTKTSDNRRLREQAKVNLAIEMELKQQ